MTDEPTSSTDAARRQPAAVLPAAALLTAPRLRAIGEAAADAPTVEEAQARIRAALAEAEAGRGGVPLPAESFGIAWRSCQAERRRRRAGAGGAR